MRQKSAFFLLAAALLLSLCMLGAGTAEGLSGETAGLRWFLSDDGMLAVDVEEGASFHSLSRSDIPWDPYRGQILSIHLQGACTDIWQYAFCDCPNLTAVALPDTVKYIHAYAFNGCGSLSEAILPDSLEVIGERAFSYCPSLALDELPVGLAEIGDYAFYGCSGLTSVSIPARVSVIGESAFRNCTGLEQVFTGENTEIISRCAFVGCTGLVSVTFGEKVTSIQDDSFLACSSLSAIDLPDGLKSIGNRAFSACNAITEITVPDSVTDIGEGAFSISGLQSLSLPFIGNSRDSVGKESVLGYVFGFKSLTSGTEYVAGAVNQLYISPNYYWYYIPASLRSVTVTDADVIPDYAFRNCLSISEIQILSEVTSIGKYAFSGCGIESFTIPESVTSIGNYAFSNTFLRQAAIPGSVASIGSYAFYDLPLQSVIFSEGLRKIDSGAFAKCGRLTSVALPSGLQTIHDHAFSQCTGITSLDIPDSVSYIGRAAFHGMNQLTRIKLPFIGVSADAAGCEGVFGIIFDYGTVSSSTASKDGGTLQFTNGYYYYWYYIPDTLHSVEISADCRLAENAFMNCSHITDLVINGRIREIGKDAFKGSSVRRVDLPDLEHWLCIDFSNEFSRPDADLYVAGELLTDAAVPESVECIHAYAFCNDTNIASLTLPDSISAIGNYAFAGCSSLTSITIPNGVTAIGEGTFAGCPALDVYCHDGIGAISPNAFGAAGTVDVHRIYCNPSTLTSASCGSIQVPFWLLSGEYELTEENGAVQVLHYYGGFASVSMPDGISVWNNTSDRFENIRLPSTLDANCSYTLSAANVTVPDGAENTGTLRLSGVQKLVIPDSVTNLSGLEILSGSPVICCQFDSKAELWAMANGYDILYLEDENWGDIYSLSYTGGAVLLDIGETYTFPADDFLISPIPDEKTVILEGSGAVAVNGLTVTGSIPGDHGVRAVFHGIQQVIPVHVHQPVVSFNLAAPRFAEQGASFDVVIENIQPEDTSLKFSWRSADETESPDQECFDSSLRRTFVIDRKPGSMQLTVTAPSGVSRTVTVLVPESISAPYAGANHRIAVVGAVINICVDVDGVTYTDDPELYNGVQINSTASKMIRELPDHRILVTAPGRCAFTAVGYDGTPVNILVAASEPDGVLSLPSSLSVIEDEAFAGTVAQKIIIPASCRKIGGNAFAQSNVVLAVIPSTVQEIAENAFSGCDHLTVVTDSDTGYPAIWCNANGINWVLSEPDPV